MTDYDAKREQAQKQYDYGFITSDELDDRLSYITACEKKHIPVSGFMY